MGAVPEFADPSCAIMAPGEDHVALAQGMLTLARKPEIFLAKSRAAATRIRETLALGAIVPQELALIRP